jgi:hypothetical protein
MMYSFCKVGIEERTNNSLPTGANTDGRFTRKNAAVLAADIDAEYAGLGDLRFVQMDVTDEAASAQRWVALWLVALRPQDRCFGGSQAGNSGADQRVRFS